MSDLKIVLVHRDLYYTELRYVRKLEEFVNFVLNNDPSVAVLDGWRKEFRETFPTREIGKQEDAATPTSSGSLTADLNASMGDDESWKDDTGCYPTGKEALSKL